MKSLGMEGISRSQVSRLAATLDEDVSAFRNRPLDAGARHVRVARRLVRQVPEAGQVVNVAGVIATAVNAEGHREILGLDVVTSEDGAGWGAFLRGLVARRLSGVSLVYLRRPQPAQMGRDHRIAPGPDPCCIPGTDVYTGRLVFFRHEGYH